MGDNSTAMGKKNKLDAPTGGITPGSRVRIVGLKNRPELNGKEARAVKWVEDRSRWRVRLGGDGQPLGLKPGNLVVLNTPASTAPATATTSRATAEAKAKAEAAAAAEAAMESLLAEEAKEKEKIDKKRQKRAAKKKKKKAAAAAAAAEAAAVKAAAAKAVAPDDTGGRTAATGIHEERRQQERRQQEQQRQQEKGEIEEEHEVGTAGGWTTAGRRARADARAPTTEEKQLAKKAPCWCISLNIVTQRYGICASDNRWKCGWSSQVDGNYLHLTAHNDAGTNGYCTGGGWRRGGRWGCWRRGRRRRHRTTRSNHFIPNRSRDEDAIQFTHTSLYWLENCA